MKKVLAVAVCAALCATTAMAVPVDVQVVQTGGTVGGVVDIAVQAQLGAGSDGLALIGWNVTVTPAGGAPAVDACDTSGFLLVSPVSMDSFDRWDPVNGGFNNTGLTNPSSSPNLSGYSGTCDGAGGLLQLGGGQNTIGNTPGNAPYPIGAVVTGVGNSGYEDIAVGFIDTAALSTGTWDICVDTVFANTLDSPAAGPPYAVSEATVGTTTCLTLGGVVGCPDYDVNCDGSVTGLDIGIVVNAANWLQPAFPGGALCDRADVNNDGNVTGLDIGEIVLPARWLTTHGPCSCTTATPGAGGCPTP